MPLSFRSSSAMNLRYLSSWLAAGNPSSTDARIVLSSTTVSTFWATSPIVRPKPGNSREFRNLFTFDSVDGVTFPVRVLGKIIDWRSVFGAPAGAHCSEAMSRGRCGIKLHLGFLGQCRLLATPVRAFFWAKADRRLTGHSVRTETLWAGTRSNSAPCIGVRS